jgi:anthranilate phosphoribosyltransferase
VADAARAPIIADALRRLGAVHALVVHGEIGLDEIAPVGRTTVWEVRGGGVREWSLDPRELGVATESLDGLEGGEPAENAARIVALFSAPAEAPPALRSAVILNAAAALYVGGAAATMPQAVALAQGALMSGAALARLRALVAASTA